MTQDESMHWPSTAATDFEDQHGIRVIEMRDFGSRSNNMDGPTSDKDAMFIFDQPAMDHKLLQTEDSKHVDAIHTEKYGVDFHGWDLRKFGDLLSDSNPQAIEFLNSEIQYYTAYPAGRYEEPFEELRQYANRNFNPIRLYMHNRSKAKSNYEKYILKKLIGQHGEEGQYVIENEDETRYKVRQKGSNEEFIIQKHDVGEDKPYRLATTDRSIRRNLKVIQAVLYARHIRRTGSLPQMDFEKFLDHSVEAEIQARVMDFLYMKRDGEGDMAAGNPFNDLIEYELEYEVDHKDLNRRGIEAERVNEFMREIDGLLFD